MKAVRGYERVLAWLLCIFMIVYPFIMGFHVEEPSGIAETYFAKKSGYLSDTFQYYKEVFLILFAAVMAVLLSVGAALRFIIEEKFPKRYCVERKVLVLTAAFLILHILSCVSGEYMEYAVMGLCLDYEGLAALTGYAVLFFAGYLLLGNEQGKKILFTGLRALTVVLLIMACAECAAGPLFNMEGVAEAFTPERYEHLLENVFLDYHGSLSLTFANPGYFGGMCALLCPVLYGASLLGKRLPLCVFDGILAGGLVFCIVMSGSTGAAYAAAFALAAETVCIAAVKRRQARYWCAAVVIGTAAVFFVFMGQTQIMDGKAAAQRLGASVINSQYTKGGDVFSVDKITLTDGRLCIESEERALYVSVKENRSGAEIRGIEDICFTDGEGNEIASVQEGGVFRLLNGYGQVRAEVSDGTLSLDLGYQDPLEFYCLDGALYYIDFNGSLLENIPQPQISGMEWLYPLFTGRGYIWVSALPVLRECLLLGKGVGSFPFVFPQSEAAGMLNVHGSADYCIEIAHSWYLQTAVSGGVPALLSMLALFGLHLYRGTRRIAAAKVTAGTGLFFGVIAFQIAGIVNNSAVTTAPVFWILFGCSMGLLKSSGKKQAVK